MSFDHLKPSTVKSHITRLGASHISPDRIGVGCLKRKQETRVRVDFHQDSSARAAKTMFGRTLLKKSGGGERNN
jgi:hypothetical protein